MTAACTTGSAVNAVLIALASPTTVLPGLAGTVISVPLMSIFCAAVSDTGALVPATVGKEVFQASLPISTQVLYRSLKSVELVCVVVGPPRL